MLPVLSSKLSEAHDKDKSSQKMSSYGAQAVSGHENLVETIHAQKHCKQQGFLLVHLRSKNKSLKTCKAMALRP